MGTPTMGVQARMAFDTALPFDTSSIPLEFVSEALKKKGQIIDTAGLRGTRSHSGERTRTGPYTVSGPVTFEVDYEWLDAFLSCILGGTPTAGVFGLAETIPSFFLMIDRGPKVFTYAGCKVSRALFKASAREQKLRATLDLEAQSETVGDAGTFPALTMPAKKPYIFADGALSVHGSTRAFSEMECLIDNRLVTDRFVNELTRSQIPSKDREVTLSTNHPWTSSETDLYGQALAGAAGTLVFTNGDESNSVLTFSFAALQYPDRSPTVGSKSEVKLPLRGIARKSGATPELQITNAHT